MKKRKMMGLLATAMIFATVLTGCGGSASTSGEDKGTQASTQVETEAAQDVSSEAEAANYVVTFYDSDGTTVLKTEEVESGACVTEYTPEKEGYIFAGWFATPQMSHVFDFATEITADTSVFAGFVSYVEDTRSFAIVGSGSSAVLMESNWGKVIGDAQTMTKEENDSANIYTITLDLNEGDEFQFAINTSWHAQRGYGYLDTISKDGTDYFKNSGSLGEASTKRSNIKCAVAGNYTFTLTTYPGEDIYETENASYTEENKEKIEETEKITPINATTLEY